jgi:hypothetical protein
MFLSTSCRGGGKQKKDQDTFTVPDSVMNEQPNMLEEEVKEDIIYNLACPVEIADLLNRLSIPFSTDYLFPSGKMQDLITDIQKAYGLGIYGADLGYQSMYGKNTQILDYISNIKDLSEDLKIGQFFDFNTLKRLSASKSNLDSLMYIAVRSFNDIDKYLRQQHRGEISAMIITGLWLEGMYLATQLENDYPKPELKERIGEQKLILEDLFTLLSMYKDKKEIAKLLEKLTPLKNMYDGVKITVTPGEPETVEKDGRLVIIQHEESKVEYSDELLHQITNEFKTLRDGIIGK